MGSLTQCDSLYAIPKAPCNLDNAIRETRHAYQVGKGTNGPLLQLKNHSEFIVTDESDNTLHSSLFPLFGFLPKLKLTAMRGSVAWQEESTECFSQGGKRITSPGLG